MLWIASYWCRSETGSDFFFCRFRSSSGSGTALERCRSIRILPQVLHVFKNQKNVELTFYIICGSITNLFQELFGSALIYYLQTGTTYFAKSETRSRWWHRAYQNLRSQISFQLHFTYGSAAVFSLFTTFKTKGKSWTEELTAVYYSGLDANVPGGVISHRWPGSRDKNLEHKYFAIRNTKIKKKIYTNNAGPLYIYRTGIRSSGYCALNKRNELMAQNDFLVRKGGSIFYFFIA